MSHISLAQALDTIHANSWQNQTPGLTRITALLEALGNPHKALKFVHVAGTNGKGSTCACIAAMLQAAGYRVGLNTSPYIHQFNERIQVNGQMISDDQVCHWVERLLGVVEALPFCPTEFEWITAMAMLQFQAEGCDLVVLEVGLGGELDASNVIDCPEVAVITALGLDHTAFLGNTISQVASAKAGIIKPGGTVVTYGHCPEGDAVIQARCVAQNAQLIGADFSRLGAIHPDLLQPMVRIVPYDTMALGLAGGYQPYNALVAVTVVETLMAKGWQVTPEHMAQGLARVDWMGRFEVLSKAPLVVLDGAHNPQGMEAVAHSVATYFTQSPVVVLGVLEDKDVTAMLETLATFAAQVYTVTPPSPRAMDAVQLAQRLQAMGIMAQSCDTVPQAMEQAVANDAPVLALGSLYLCDDVRQCFV